MALTDWLAQTPAYMKGKKTYAVAAVICVLGFLEAFDIWTVPEYLWPLIAAVGLGCMRSGVKGVKDSIKEIKMDTKTILLAAVLVTMTGGPLRAGGLTVWGLAEKDLDSSQNAVAARIGYQHDYIEAFLGSTWRPRYDTETGEVSPPQIFSLGCLVHMRDLLDPNNPLPWIPGTLLMMIPEKMVARPYFGVMGTINLLDQDAGHTGFPVGLLCQGKETDRAAYIVELQLFNQHFGDLSAVKDDAWTFYIGLRYFFGRR